MTWRPSANLVTLLATVVVCVLLYAVASVRYYSGGFFSLGVFIDFFRNNAYLGIAAVGLTFVILSGGIDLSVGAVVALTSILLARLVEQHNVHPAPAIAIVLLIGTAMGAVMGGMIHVFQLAPFFVTLAGMFFARGAAFLISDRSIELKHPWFAEKVWELEIPLGGLMNLLRNLGLPIEPTRVEPTVPFVAIAFLVVALIGMYLSRWTRFGRFSYAIGGNEQSAVLMGLPVGRTKVAIYAFGGFCSALAGVIWATASSAGNANAGTMMELDAIAAVVLGGTLLSGGIGSVLGTVFGVLILAIIQTIVNYSNLTSWWTRIAVGALLLLFIMMQKLLTRVGAVRAG